MGRGLPHAGHFGGHADVRLSSKGNPERIIDPTQNDTAQHPTDATEPNVGDGATPRWQARVQDNEALHSSGLEYEASGTFHE